MNNVFYFLKTAVGEGWWGGGGGAVDQKHTTSTKTYQYEDDQSMEPKY